MPVDFDRLAARLRGRPRQSIELPGYRESAVLVPIVTDPGRGERLVFIVRHSALRAHAGQIAFPGGGRDPGDRDLSATAIREAHEELAIPPERTRVLGLLDDVPTPTGYVITPVVARVEGPLALVPQPGEVADWFVADVEGLRRPGCYRLEGERTFLGVRYAMHTYRWAEWTIWGATARILHELLGILEGGEGG